MIKINLCPFAGKGRFVVDQPEGLCAIPQWELEFLRSLPVEHGNHALNSLIHIDAFNVFLDYNDSLGVADALLEDKNYVGEFQVESFRPIGRMCITMPAGA